MLKDMNIISMLFPNIKELFSGLSKHPDGLRSC